MSRRVQVFGPAYLDRVLRVDRPLVDHEAFPPLDQSVDGSLRFGEGLTLVDPSGSAIAVDLPSDWPGPRGDVLLARPLPSTGPAWSRSVTGVAWHDDLGGMGAGFAAALGGELISALGPEDDPTSREISGRLARAGISHRPVRVAAHPADWTLLVTSGEFGDKLPIGFRGCHAALSVLPPELIEPSEVRVVASLANGLAAQVLRAGGAKVRLFAPAMRNVVDREVPVSSFAEVIDVLCCNRREWESLDDREEVAWRLSILAITDGPAGSVVHFTTPTGEAARVRTPAFPRDHPPADTNRAGEAFAATFLETLLEEGWRPGVAEEETIRRAAQRASVAAALVLDRLEFGFPSRAEVERAIQRGRVG